MKKVLIAALLLLSACASTPKLDANVKISIGQIHGSGIHIGNGNILTAAHVIQDGKIIIKTPDGLVRDGTVSWINEQNDIALVHVENYKGLGSKNLACRKPILGEELKITSNPANEEFVLTYGYVAKITATLAHEPWKNAFVADLTIAPGSSGAGVLDGYGMIIGIASAVQMFQIETQMGRWATVPSGLAYIISSKKICELLGKN